MDRRAQRAFGYLADQLACLHMIAGGNYRDSRSANVLSCRDMYLCRLQRLRSRRRRLR